MELVKLERIWHSGTNEWKDETSQMPGGVPSNSCARIEGVLVRINARRQDTKWVVIRAERVVLEGRRKGEVEIPARP